MIIKRPGGSKHSCHGLTSPFSVTGVQVVIEHVLQIDGSIYHCALHFLESFKSNVIMPVLVNSECGQCLNSVSNCMRSLDPVTLGD